MRDPSAPPAPLRALVVDDELLARERLIRILERIDGAACIGEASNGRTALAQIASLHPDVLLLDIDMPGIDGLELAATPGIPPIIFVTAHVHFAPDAFDLDAVDFLAKPVREDRLVRALDRVRRRVSGIARTPASKLAVYDAGSVRFVDTTNVTVFRSRDKYTDFLLSGEELLVRESLDALTNRLGPDFVRVHRNALVRTSAITELTQDERSLFACLSDGTRVEVSRRMAPVVRRALGIRK